MLVKMNCSITGPGKATPRGGLRDCSDAEAVRLCAKDLASLAGHPDEKEALQPRVDAAKAAIAAARRAARDPRPPAEVERAVAMTEARKQVEALRDEIQTALVSALAHAATAIGVRKTAASAETVERFDQIDNQALLASAEAINYMDNAEVVAQQINDIMSEIGIRFEPKQDDIVTDPALRQLVDAARPVHDRFAEARPKFDAMRDEFDLLEVAGATHRAKMAEGESKTAAPETDAEGEG